MMLTGGVEAEVGKSALVGLPVSRVGVTEPDPDVVPGAGPGVVPGAGPRPATAGPDAVAAADVTVFHEVA
jgi:hypothetical protein